MAKSKKNNHISLALALREIIDDCDELVTAKKIATKALGGLNQLNLTYTITRKEYMKLNA